MSHELVESITDPDTVPPTGAALSGRTGWWPEIGDTCIGVLDTFEQYTVQDIWSIHAQMGMSIQPELSLGRYQNTLSQIPDATLFVPAAAEFLEVNAQTSSEGIYESTPINWGTPECYTQGNPILEGNFVYASPLTSFMTYCGPDATWEVWESSATFDRGLPSVFAVTNRPPYNFGDAQEDPIFVGDFNGDGLTDVGFYHWGDGSVWIGLNSGGGSFEFVSEAHIGSGQSNQNGPYPSFVGDRVIIADFNGDGFSDFGLLHLADGSLWVGLQSKTGAYLVDGNYTGGVLQWASPSSVSTMGTPVQIANAVMLQGHFHSTTDTDLMFYVNTTGTWWVVPSTGSSFGNPLPFATTGGSNSFGPFLTADWFSVTHMAPGNFDGIFFYHNSPQGWWTLASNGSSFSIAPVSYGSTGFGNLLGDIYSPYPAAYNGLAGGLVFYDNANQYFGHVYETQGGGFALWQWFGSPTWSSTLGHLFGS